MDQCTRLPALPRAAISRLLASPVLMRYRPARASVTASSSARLPGQVPAQGSPERAPGEMRPPFWRAVQSFVSRSPQAMRGINSKCSIRL